MDEQKLLELYVAQDERAVEETEKRYGKLCFKIAFNILGSNEDAKECVNDTYLALWNSIPRSRPDDLTAFVCKVARNQALKKAEYLQRQKRSSFTVSLDELSELFAEPSALDNIEDGELGKLINGFLASEKEAARNVFIRKYFFFDSIEDISRRYSFSVSKVKSILFHTRNKLKRYLKEHGVEI